MSRTTLFKQLEVRGGPLQIWEPPIEGKKYVLSVDCCGGGGLDDWACGMVIRADNCSLVAKYREKVDPAPWGRLMFGLGSLYFGALMAVETYPATHGLACVHEAVRLGYPNIYRRSVPDRMTQLPTEKLGWATNVQTKPLIIARIKEGLNSDIDIPDAELVAELRTQRWNAATRKMEHDAGSNDDQVITYGIGLVVRDEAWQRDELRSTRPTAKTVDEQVWEQLLRPTTPEGRVRASY